MTQNKGIQEEDSDLEKKDFWKAKSELAMSINDASIDGLITLDSNFIIISCNKVIESWSGRYCEELTGKSFFEAFPTAATLNFNDAFKHALKGMKSFIPSEPGHYFNGYFETHIVPLKDDSGDIHGILQIIHDVAHRVKAENQLRELNEKLQIQYSELQHAHEEIATFAKIAAHDLMEPIRKIYLFGEQIKRNEAERLSDSGKGNIRRMQTSIQRLGLLIDDITSFLALNTSNKEAEDVDLNATLLKVYNHLQNEIDQSGISISSSDLPVIKGSAFAIEQIFRQLISNALKFRRSDVKPELLIDYDKIAGKDKPFKEALHGQTYYCISFHDNGIGFEPGHSERIFGLFQTLHPHGAYRGSGKGLAIALKATRLHKGFIKAESQPGIGSTFYCYLPI